MTDVTLTQAGAVPGGRGGGGAAGQVPAHRQRAGLSAGGRADRAVRGGVRLFGLRGELDPALRRVRRGAAAVPDRPGAASQAPVGHARGHLRPGRGAGRRHRPRARGHCHRARPGVARRAVRRPCAVAVVDRLCAADPGGEGRAGAASRPAGVRDPALPGPGGDPADRLDPAVRRLGARRGAADAIHRRPAGDRHHRGGGRGGTLSARRRHPHHRPHAREGGHDGLRAADRRRRDAGDGEGGAVGVARRLHRRRAAGGFRLPPRDRGRHRAVRGPAAGPLLHRHRHVAQPRAWSSSSRTW